MTTRGSTVEKNRVEGTPRPDALRAGSRLRIRGAGHPGGPRSSRIRPPKIAHSPLTVVDLRAETLAIREREFVMAGRALGMSHLRIIFRQILPNLTSAIVVIATLQVAQVIIAESFLSFLGLGIQPPTPAWGNMLGEGRLYMLNSWWIATFPGLAIFVTTLMINLMGNALRDWLDPHMKL